MNLLKQVIRIFRISKYKNKFGKDYVTNSSAGVFVIKKVKSTVTYVISDIKGEETVGNFNEKLEKTNQKVFKVEKVIKKKSDKLYVNGKAMMILLTV